MNYHLTDANSSAAVFSLGVQTGLMASIRRIVQDLDRSWRQAVIDQLNCLVALEKGWDGYRGGPVRFDTAHFALRLLDSACGNDTPSPEIVPGSDGDLQIEWHLEAGDIELHVSGPLKVHAWARIDGVERDADLTNDFTTVAQWLAMLADQELAATAAA